MQINNSELNAIDEASLEDLENLIEAAVYDAEDGELEALLYLIANEPNAVKAFIQADDYWAFRKAARDGQLDIIKHFVTLLPDQVQTMIASEECDAFEEAVENNHAHVTKYLIELAPEAIQTHLASEDYDLFDNLVEIVLIETACCLLQLPLVLAFATKHHDKYGERCVYRFITEEIESLRRQKTAFEIASPHGIFNFSSELKKDELGRKVVSCFYMLRNLIQRYTPALKNDILFLIQIPSVQSLRHCLNANEQICLNQINSQSQNTHQTVTLTTYSDTFFSEETQIDETDHIQASHYLH